jgi:phosphatidylglycerol---prolipoprotein diacylglyceryl transferase
MYPTFSDLLYDLIGIQIPLPIQMFGLMVAISFLVGNYIIGLELKRKYTEGLLSSHTTTVIEGLPSTKMELLSNAIFGFIIGFKLFFLIGNYAQFTANPQAALLSFEGSFWGGIISAFAMAYWAYYEKNSKKLAQPITKTIEVMPHQVMGNLTILAAVFGILGAKLFHNLENFDTFLADPIGALLSFSGLTFYGGLICGITAAIWYARSKNIKTIHLLDAAAPGIMIAYGIGRLGCQLSGDGDWGIVNTAAKPSWISFLPDWVWSFKFPHNVISDGVPIPGCVGRHCMELPLPVYPTSLYEAIIAITLFLVLWAMRKRIKIPGLLFSIYLMMNGMERFFIEKIRINNIIQFAGFQFTQAELISSIIFLLGVTSFVYLILKNNQKNGSIAA